MNELREMILQERDERKEEAKTMDDFFRTENDERKKVTPKELFTCDDDTNEEELNISSKFAKKAKIIPNNNFVSSLCNFKVSYAKHWKSDWSGLEVAHRGLGNSYTKSQR